MENFRGRGNPLERDSRISMETRELENKEQTARKELKNFSKPLERDWKILI